MGKTLPKNWVETELGNYSILKNGYAFKSKDFKNVGIPVIRISNITGNRIDLSNATFVDESLLKSEFIIEKGDVLIAMSGATTGKYGLYLSNDIALQNQRVGNLKPIIDELANKKFIYYLLSNIKPIVEELAYGGAQPNISPKLIEGILISLPPLPEQERIANKLDALFSQIDGIRTAMERIPLLLKNFRQQVLTQAVTGKLTDVNPQKRYLKELLLDVKYGTSKKSDYDIDGIPVLRIPNINEGEINLNDLKYTIFEGKEYEQLKLKDGDILIIRSNGSISLVGQTAIVRKKHEGYSYAGYLIRMRCNQDLDPEFLNYSLRSGFVRSQIIDLAHSTSGVNNINAEQIKGLKICWFSIPEQQEIVCQLKSLFSKADTIEQQYKNLKQKIDNLPQAILHKAFKGELVEQLATDGDARDLLQQIEELKKLTKKK